MAPKPFPVGQLSQPPSSGGSLQARWPGSLRPGPGMPHDHFSWSLHPHDDENRYMFSLGCGVSLKENYHVTHFKASETVEGCVTSKTSSAFIAWKEQMRCILSSLPGWHGKNFRVWCLLGLHWRHGEGGRNQTWCFPRPIAFWNWSLGELSP